MQLVNSWHLGKTTQPYWMSWESNVVEGEVEPCQLLQMPKVCDPWPMRRTETKIICWTCTKNAVTLLPFMFYIDCGNICLGLVWGHVMVFGAILQYALLPSHLVHSVASIVLRVPSGWPASSWHGLGRWGLGGIGELIIFCMCWTLCEFYNIFSLGNSRLCLWPSLVRAALQGRGTTPSIFQCMLPWATF